MLSCVVYGSTGQADQPTDRRAVHNGAATLLAHLLQLVFHAVPDAAEVDRDHAIEFRAAGIRRFDRGTLYAGVIEGGIQPSKDLHCLIDHRRHLGLVGDVAAARAGLKRHVGAARACRFRRLEERINTHRAGEVLGRTLGGGL